MTWRHAPLLLASIALLSSCNRKDQATGTRPVVAEAGAAVGPPPPPPKPKPELTIVYASDLRGHVSPDPAFTGPGGLGRRATVVDRIKMEGPALQVEAGDLVAGAADELPPAGYDRNLNPRIVFASFSRLGVDAIAIGERDLELGRDRLKAAVKAADLQVVAANLFGKGDERPFPPDRVVEVGGQSVGVFGVLDIPADRAADLQKWGFRTGDAAEAANAEVQSLRSRGVRLVVGLFHVLGGRPRAEEILARTSGIDLAVLGHVEGPDAEGAAVVNQTQLVFEGSLGGAIGRLDVRDLGSDAGVNFEDQKVKLTPAIPEQIGVSLIERAVVADVRRKQGVKEPLYPPRWDYASIDACGGCHDAEIAQWKTTDHARALASLQKYKHDHDLECLGCHMTGYLEANQTTNLDQMVKYFSNVSCESCHGPSAAHIRTTNKKFGTSLKVSADVCMGCHTEDQGLGEFDYATALKAIVGPGHGAPLVRR
jgi:hypothetical protein